MNWGDGVKRHMVNWGEWEAGRGWTWREAAFYGNAPAALLGTLSRAARVEVYHCGRAAEAEDCPVCAALRAACGAVQVQVWVQEGLGAPEPYW